MSKNNIRNTENEWHCLWTQHVLRLFNSPVENSLMLHSFVFAAKEYCVVYTYHIFMGRTENNYSY